MFSKTIGRIFSSFGNRVYISATIVIVTVITVVYQCSKRRTQAGLLQHVIYVVNNIEEWNAIEKDFSASIVKSKVIGLDCEWTTERKVRQPVALLQMATENICVLFRLCHFNTDLPSVLVKILADENILKVGVDIWGDRSKLLHDHQIMVRGCLDLRYLIEQTPEAAYITKFGLSGMASSILKFELCKERSIRCSNWQQEVLSKKQINYAAQDAVVSLQIFKAVVRSRLSYFTSLFLSTHSETKIYKQALLIYAAVIDVPYKSKTDNRKVEYIKIKETNSYRYLTRAKPLYDNCQLQAPDGEPLCVCDMKKAQWYLDKKLGVSSGTENTETYTCIWATSLTPTPASLALKSLSSETVEKDPFTVRLNFEPSGRPELDNKYYTQQKENCCVVCGKAETYIKKKIVPHEYRRHFPNLMKNHLSHDVLLLCVNCHGKSSSYDTVFRHALAKECDAPLCSNGNSKTHIDPVISKIHSAARALLRQQENLPKARIKELENHLKDYYEVEELTPEILQEAANLDYRISNENYISHGLKVVQYKSRTIGLTAFEAEWRQHFLDTMKPQYLPKMWSVDHNHERLFIQIKTKNVDFDVSVLSGTNGMTQK